MSLAPLTKDILEKLGPLVTENVIVGEQTFLIRRPEHSDRLLEIEAVHDAFEVDEYMPYWADLWPAARMLAKAIDKESWQPGVEAVEMGCGLGLPGIVALSKGLRVVFTDYDPCALHFAAQNARLNGFDDFRVLQVDWRTPPPDLRVPLIFGSDLIYEQRNVEPLVGFIKATLLPDGVCLLTDQDRIPAQAFREALEQEKLTFTTQIARAGEPGGRRLKGTLYRVTR